jgi:FkbM family methyltransferase
MISSIFRNIPPFKGKNRLIRFISRNKLKHARDILIKGKYQCKYFLPNLKEALAFDIYTNGIYEQETHDFLFNSLPENAVFLDLGANIGSVTIPLCKRRSDVRAYCVEAAPWIAEYLTRNLAVNNLQKVTTVHRALYMKDDETFKFFSPKDEFGKGSLSPVYTQDGTDVLTITVDTLIQQWGLNKVDFIKIDVEGYEYYTFKGAEKLLKKADAPVILFEFADWAENLATGLKAGDAQRILKEYGYNLFIFNNDRSFTPIKDILTAGNYMLFARKEHAQNL